MRKEADFIVWMLANGHTREQAERAWERCNDPQARRPTPRDLGNLDFTPRRHRIGLGSPFYVRRLFHEPHGVH